MWQLEASAHELTIILEEQQYTLAQVARIDDALGKMSEVLGSEAKEDVSKDDSERDNGDVEELAGGSL